MSELQLLFCADVMEVAVPHGTAIFQAPGLGDPADPAHRSVWQYHPIFTIPGAQVVGGAFDTFAHHRQVFRMNAAEDAACILLQGFGGNAVDIDNAGAGIGKRGVACARFHVLVQGAGHIRGQAFQIIGCLLLQPYRPAMASLQRPQRGAAGQGHEQQQQAQPDGVPVPLRINAAQFTPYRQDQGFVHVQFGGLQRPQRHHPLFPGREHRAGQQALRLATFQVAGKERAGLRQIGASQPGVFGHHQKQLTIAMRQRRPHIIGIKDGGQQHLEFFRRQGGGNNPGKFAVGARHDPTEVHGPDAQLGLEGWAYIKRVFIGVL